ncbi:hypothetical protein BJX61DRAFT_530237 [Aspergillus egyptiacus]|nr:hypothetical protein BJX61DRAFT_530237 [Aspergillus egyptiacus]
MHRHRHHHHHRHGNYLGIPTSTLKPDILPRNRPPYLLMPQHPTVVKREPLPATDEYSGRRETCGPDDDSGVCEKPTSTPSNTTLPVVLGAVYALSYPIPYIS